MAQGVIYISPVPKAPPNWRPSPDQQAQVGRDPRLQRLGRDELYAYFNKPKTGPTPRRTAPSQPQQGGRGLGSVLDQVRRAMAGG